VRGFRALHLFVGADGRLAPIIPIALLAGLLSGCTSTSLRTAVAKAPPSAATNREASTLFIVPGKFASASGTAMPSCDVQTESSEAGGSIAAPLIGIAVDTVIGAISNELAAMKAGLNASWPATTATDAIKPDGDYCLAISRGMVSAGGNSPALPDGLGFSGTPAFVLLADAHVVKASETAWRVILTPAYLGYAETAAPRRGKNRKEVSVILSFQPQGPAPAAAPEAGGAAAGEAGRPGRPEPSPEGTLRLDFGRLNVGQAYGVPLLGTVNGGTALQPASQYTITALVSESEDASAALKAFSEAYDKNKDNLSSALKDVIGKAVGEGAGR